MKARNVTRTNLFNEFRVQSHIRKPHAIYSDDLLVYTTDNGLFNLLCERGASYPEDNRAKNFYDKFSVYIKAQIKRKSDGAKHSEQTLICSDNEISISKLVDDIFLGYLGIMSTTKSKLEVCKLNVCIKVNNIEKLNLQCTTKNEVLGACNKSLFLLTGIETTSNLLDKPSILNI